MPPTLTLKDPWEIQLLGALRLSYGDRVITRFRTQKTGSLLAFLAYHRYRSHSREVLIDLFWPDAEAESGRHSLSLALSSLRNQLEPPGVPGGSVIVADRRSVELNPEAIITDVATFEQALRSAAQARTDEERREYLTTAVSHYRGQLLPGFYEDWLVTEQERLAERYQQAISELVELLEKAREYASAIEYARKALREDPLREATHRDLMRLLAAMGQVTVAMRQYRELERLLDTELGEEPSRETRQLARALQLQGEMGVGEAPKAGRQDSHPTLYPSTPLAGAGVIVAPPPSGTVTFLLTDIEGSTALWEKAGDALGCAVTAQRALAAQTWLEEAGPLLVRMAVHSGDVEIEAGEYRGLVLHRASRILAAAHGGQLLCSETTAAILRRDLETEIRFRDLGIYRLRDVEVPERLFQVDYAAMRAAEFPPLRAERALSGSLPIQFTRFFGREREIEQLREMILDPEVRLVTLTGPGGTGKTRLSIQAATRVVEALSGAVWFVALADVSDPRIIPDVLLASLQATPSPQTDPISQVVSILSQQPSLLILDNLEQMADAAAEIVGNLLERVSGLTCLVTSRQILGLPMEREFQVTPLPTPGGVEGAQQSAGGTRRLGESSTPELMGAYESVRLFVDRAQAVKPDFQVTNANAPAVAELCDRLEGIPLAIELAAARAQVLTPQQMLQQLGNRFDLLVSRRRGVSERQRTLRAAVDWSYRLLSPELQQFFSRLCVFRGGWTVEAAEAICDDSLALDRLAQLRECSLVVTEEGIAQMRFRMLETLREYACGLLTSEEQENLEERHAQFFLSFAEGAESELRGTRQAEWLVRLEEEQDNLRIALRWFQSRERVEEGLRLTGALWYFWSIRSHFAEGRRALDEILALATPSHPNFGRSALRATVLLGAGALAHDQSRYEEAAPLLEESIGLFREHAERAGLAAALNIRANLALDQGDTSRAMPLYQEALGLFREVRDARGAAIVLSNLGVLALDEGDLDRASQLLSESVQLKRRIANPYGLANSLDSLGNVERSRGKLDRAIQLYDEALTIRRKLGNRHGAAVALNNLAHARLLFGDPGTARAHLVEAFGTFQELGEPRGLCECLALLAGVAAAEGHADEAARCIGAVEALRKENSIQLPDTEREAEEILLAPARTALGEEAYAAAKERGSALDVTGVAALLRLDRP